MSEEEELSENIEEEVPETSEPEIKEEESGTSEEPEAPKDTGIRKRINALTAEKYAQKRRADAAEKQFRGTCRLILNSETCDVRLYKYGSWDC